MIRKIRFGDIDGYLKLKERDFSDEIWYAKTDYKKIRSYMKIAYIFLKIFFFLPTIHLSAFDIFVYKKNNKLVGYIKISPLNQDKTHWYFEEIAVDKEYRKQGIGRSLQRYALSYVGKSRKIFASVRAENIASLKICQRDGLGVYSKKFLMIGRASDSPKVTIKGFRTWKQKDAAGVYELYKERTPEDIRRIEDKSINDFKESIFDRIFEILQGVFFLPRVKFVLEKNNRIVSFLEIEFFSEDSCRIDLMINQNFDEPDKIVSKILDLCKGKEIVCFVPEYRKFEREVLLKNKFKTIDIYYSIGSV